MESWPALESNPQVLNDFARKCGLPEEWAFGDVFGFDDDLLAMVPQPCLAVIFLFPSSAKVPFDETKKGTADTFFLRQIKQLDQACGTIAMIHAIANNADVIQLRDGSLKKFIESHKNSSAEEVGTALAGDKTMSEMHSSFAQEGQTNSVSADNVDHHFVCFTSVGEHLYEFDGCKTAPTDHGKIGENGFLSTAAKVIKATYLTNPDVMDFAMMSLGPPGDF